MQKVSETWPIPIFKGLTVFSFLISHWMRAHFFCLWLRMHKVNMSLGEKIMSSIQTASHGSFGKRTSEGAVPSTDYIPASLSRESFHGHLLQAQPCMTKKNVSQQSAVCSWIPLGDAQNKFCIFYCFFWLRGLSSMPNNLRVSLKKEEYFTLWVWTEISGGLHSALRARVFNVERKIILSITQIKKKIKIFSGEETSNL